MIIELICSLRYYHTRVIANIVKKLLCRLKPVWTKDDDLVFADRRQRKWHSVVFSGFQSGATKSLNGSTSGSLLMWGKTGRGIKGWDAGGGQA